MKFSIFASVATLAASVFAAPVAEVKRDELVATLETKITTAVTQVTAITTQVKTLVAAGSTDVSTVTSGLLELNVTLTAVLDVMVDLDIDVGADVTALVSGLLGTIGVTAVTTVSGLLHDLEAAVGLLLQELSGATDLTGDLTVVNGLVTKVTGGLLSLNLLGDVSNIVALLVGVLSLLTQLPIIGSVVSGLLVIL